MKFGVCASIEQAQTAYDAGFDYIECTVASLMPEKSDSEVRDILVQFSDSPLPVEAFNIFIPQDLNLAGETVDYVRIHRYLDQSLQRVRNAGGSTVVFGSGGARNIPKGFPMEKGQEQLVKFLGIVADYAEPLGITIVIEPLYQKASNIIHTVPEAVRIAKMVNRNSIQVLADFFHMVEEEDSLDHIVQYKDYIRHIHTSDNYRPPGTGSYPYDQFVDCIHQANYDGRISIECIWNDFDHEVKDSLKFVKAKFEHGSNTRSRN